MATQVIPGIPGPDGSGMIAWLDHAHHAVETAGLVPVETLTDTDIATAVGSLACLEAKTIALRLRLSVEADARDLAGKQAQPATDAWLAALTGQTRNLARGGIWLARRLQETYHHTRDAFAAGQLGFDQVKVIVDAADKMPTWVSQAQRADAEEALVAAAVGINGGPGLDAKALRRRARRMLEVLGTDAADEHETQLLDDEATRARAETWLQLHDNGDGTWTGSFSISDLHGSMLRAALDRLTSPRRHTRSHDGTDTTDQTVADASTNRHERDGHAFCEIIEHLPTDGWHPTTTALILITLAYQHLITDTGTATLDTGTPITAREARRLACTAGLIPVVLDTDSVPLDMGHTARHFTSHQRYALSLIHHTCAIDGCDRPYAWCELHHLTPWSARGPTNLNNALPLCAWHHHHAHHPHWQLTQLTTTTWKLTPTKPPNTTTTAA